MLERADAGTIELGASASSGVRRSAFAPDTFERVLALGSMLMLAAVLAALARGHSQWHLVPPVIWAHLLTIITALGLTPMMLLRPRGDRLHRVLGWIWASSMALTAAISLAVKVITPGHFSLIHLLSVYTLVQVPIIVFSARNHNIKRHRGGVRGMVTGALLIAGFFTFPFGRLMGAWLFG